MLKRKDSPNGVVVYQSPLLERCGVAHAFSTRIGGVSPQPFHWLNLAGPVPTQGNANVCRPGDCESNTESPESGSDASGTARNFALLAQAIDCAAHYWVTLRQVHGAVVRVIDGEQPIPDCQGDAMATRRAGLLLAIRTADCVPVLLADETGQVAAAVHAGWRGLVAGVIPTVVTTIGERFHVRPGRMIAAIGPCISGTHYEVGSEVAAAFTAAGLGEAVIERGPLKPHVNLAAAAAAHLRQAGIEPKNIDQSDRCTFADADEFYSHRRDGLRAGRMAAVIAVRQ